ncbi:glycoside hydrolase, partial [Coemansia spiralis]
QSDEERRDAVKAAMKHAWEGYRQYAFGDDELQPVTNRSNNKWGGWGVTLVDALDTLYIMGLHKEFNQGVTHVVNVDFSKAKDGYTTPFFEMIIRSLAGLLTAYEMSLDRRLLAKAQQIGDVLLPAFDTPTGIPYPRVDVNAKKAVHSDRVCLAEAGTVQLEYWKLSELTGNPAYHEMAQRVVDILDEAEKPYPGLYPIWIDTKSAKLVSGQITFGGQGDSWYEYMLKQYIFSRRSNDQYRRMYEESIDAMKEKMVQRSIYDPQMYYVGDLDSTAKKFSPKYQHLTCFVPGMLALGSKVLDRPDDLELAKNLAYTCFQMYNLTATGLGPEYVLFRDSKDKGLSPSNKDGDDDFAIIKLASSSNTEKKSGFYFGGNRGYILRPETLESLMILYRITGDSMYKEWGWQIFKSIEKWTKTRSAYSAYKDVTSTKGSSELSDSMESFFLAETLKYLYLLFSPAGYYSLDEYVFNTEAHPFKIL